MKPFNFLAILLSNLVLSQNLVFTNNQETIIFKKNELININGQKYLYQKAVKNKTQIHLMKSGFLRKDNIILDTSKIETFRTHKVRFSGRNALKNGFSGFKIGLTCGGILGLGLGVGWEGFTGASKPSFAEKVGVGLLSGALFGTSYGVAGGLIGLVNGFFSKGESELYHSGYYKIKFNYNNKNTLIKPRSTI